MILIKLFLCFLEVGAVSFGGGYSMIPLVKDIVLSQGWLSEEEFMDFIAVSESTPGPIAVNMATFIGAKKAGLPGSFLATLGVILPAFAAIFLICSVLRNLLRYKSVNAFLEGVRPCTVGLIIAASVTLALPALFGLSKSDRLSFDPDIISIGIFAFIAVLSTAARFFFGKKPSPVMLIIISATLGAVLYSFF